MDKHIPKIEWLENPEIFRANRIDAHSDHLYFETVEEAENLKELKLKQSLNGVWKFSYAENPDERIKDFYRKDFDFSSFAEINVPGHIQMQGFDKMQYINTLYPWDGREHLRPPYISKKYNPVGSYVKEFEIDENLKDKRTFLSFQGVETAFYVWVNGKFVGYSEDSFTPSEFDVTSCLKDGKNRVAVEVYKRSSAIWLEDQDFWRFSGIFREVYLYAVPKTHIKDIFVKTDLSKDFKNAEIEIDLAVLGEIKGTVDILVKNPTGKEVASLTNYEINEELTINFPLQNVELWSAENPVLYNLTFIVHDENKNVVEVIPQKIGIRKFELENGIMKLNGKRIVFKGVNRHEFSHKKGRAITKEDMLWDIKFMKQHNINAVRTSHYPNNSLWYKLCDEYGIYLIDETNLETHGTWMKMGKSEPSWNVPGSLPEWQEAVLDRAESMLERDKNHPSVLIWSCGNESYAGEDILNMTRYFHKRDPRRIVHYEGCFWNREFNDCSDMESRMYAKVKEIDEYLSTNPEKPYISCEYMHAMGNSCGGMMKYTELEDKYEQYQGGFIWDYIDQAVAVEKNGKDVLYYGGDFMERPSDYSFCGNGIVFADRTVTPKAQEVKYLYQNVVITPNERGVVIRNKALFENLSKYKFVYSLKQEDKVLVSGEFETECKAGEKVEVLIPWGDAPKGTFTRNVSMILKEDTLWEKAGFEIGFGQEVVENKADEVKADEINVDFEVVEGDGNIGAKAGDTRVLFGKDKGLVSLTYNGKEMIIDRPQPIFWRASTDNDKGYNHPHTCAMWLGASLCQKVRLESWNVSEDKKSLTVNYVHEIPVVPAVETVVSYTFDYTGNLKVTVEYMGKAGLPELPILAMRFKFAKEFDRFRYFGKGPEENYIDRNMGVRVDVFERKVAENLTPYLVPQECGNRTETRWAEIIDENNNGIKFVYDEKTFEFSVLPNSFLELEQATHKYELSEHNYTYVTIAMKQMGVGGDDSWGAPVLEEFCIPSDKNYKYSFNIVKAGGNR